MGLDSGLKYVISYNQLYNYISIMGCKIGCFLLTQCHPPSVGDGLWSIVGCPRLDGWMVAWNW